MKLLTILLKQLLGKFGETYATTYLQKKGYHIIECNFKARYGEIDIICTKDNVLIFVEVKTRIGDEFGTPEEAVTPKKLREVIKTANYYVQCHSGVPDAMRIDVIGIVIDDISEKITYFNHIESVTS